MSTPITQHFEIGEFSSHDGVPFPPEWIQERLLPLCQQLEIIRSTCGDRPITITSGYRSVAHNREIGGALHSQHVQGRAADIAVEGLAPSDVHKVILQLFWRGKIEIGALGQYPSWCHVDIRSRPSDGHLCQWQGSGVGSEQAT